MVVDKDVEGLGEWTLGEVKTEWVRTLTVLLFRWKDQSWGYGCNIDQVPLHWEDHSWCKTRCGVLGHLQHHPAGLPQCSWQLRPLCILQFHLCFSKLSLSLHLRMKVSLNVSTSWLSRSGITTPLGSIHAHSLVPRPFIHRKADCADHWTITQFERRDFPQPLPPTFWRNCRNRGHGHCRLKSKESHFSDPFSNVDDSR